MPQILPVFEEMLKSEEILKSKQIKDIAWTKYIWGLKESLTSLYIKFSEKVSRNRKGSFSH